MTSSTASSNDTQLSKLIENHLTLQREYQRLEDRFMLLESKLENPGSPSSTHATKYYMKLEIPHFDGNNPLKGSSRSRSISITKHQQQKEHILLAFTWKGKRLTGITGWWRIIKLRIGMHYLRPFNLALPHHDLRILLVHCLNSPKLL